MSRHPLPQNKPTPTTSSQSSPTRKTRPRRNLVEIATRLAGQHELWEPLVRYDPISRYYARLASEPDFEAWLLTWVPGQGTDWHDHGGSAGAFVVVRGELTERTATVSPLAPPRIVDEPRVLTDGSLRAFGTKHIHQVTNNGSGAGGQRARLLPRPGGDRAATPRTVLGCGRPARSSSG